MSKSNSFVAFTNSDKGLDASQTTVPFLDSQEITANPPMSLQGIGLFYKGEYGFGGFIALKIETLDYSNLNWNAEMLNQ